MAYALGMDANDNAAAARALQAAKQERWSFAESQIAKTRDPLAAKIYYWMYYTEAKGPFAFNRVSAFVRQVPDWPQQGTLQLAAEKSINDNTPSEAIVRWFKDYSPRTADGMDRYMRAMQAQGMQKEMGTVISAWWGDASLTNEQQVRFLRNYG